MLQLRATIPSNGRVDVVNGPGDLAGQQTLPVSAGTEPTVFYIRRIGPGGITVPLVVVDVCGEWPTFVGGGQNAF